MIDHNADGLLFPKKVDRFADAQKRRADFRKADEQARDRAWATCKGICRRCGKLMDRGSPDMRLRAEYNHTSQPREGGRKTHQGEWLHGRCHRPHGAHQRRAK